MTETLDTPRFSGIGQFGPAYRYMLENDSHAAGSVDRVLAQRMIRLCPETVEYLYGAHTLLDITYPRGRDLAWRFIWVGKAPTKSGSGGFLSGSGLG